MALRATFIALTVVCQQILSGSANPVERATSLPSYVLTYAPYSHLWSQEEWWPSDVATHVQHVVPEVNFAPVAPSVTLENISSLAGNVYLTSKDNVENNPAWLLSALNEPTSTGYSAAPATIIAVQKSGGIVDAFYFYFYSYNHGNKYVLHATGVIILLMNLL
jgi:hypothetical protein